MTPVDADLTVGGEHDTQTDEDNMVKVQTGDSSNTEYTADTVQQTYQTIQEYPLWLVIGFALAVGLALPSPLSALSNWRTRRMLERQLERADARTEALHKMYLTSLSNKGEHHG